MNRGALPGPVYDDGQITLYQGDCRKILPLLDPVDLIVTDPPYGDIEFAIGGSDGR